MPSSSVGSSSLSQDVHAAAPNSEDARIVARHEQAVLVRRADGSRLLVPTAAVTPTADGRCRLDIDLAALPAVATAEAIIIPVIEETLHIDKRVIETGGVRITKTWRERVETVDEPLLKQAVMVERRAVDRPATEADLAAFREGTLEVRETVEEPVVDKVARVVEEVVVGRTTTERTATIRETVRRTEVNVENPRRSNPPEHPSQPETGERI